MTTIFTIIVAVATLPIFYLTVRQTYKAEDTTSEVKWNFGK